MDYTRLLTKLVPESEAGGTPQVRIRSATVTAVNSDGTLDLVTGDGTALTDVPRLAGAVAFVGAVVQILVTQGAMLVIGATAPGPGGAMVKTGSFTGGPSGTTFFSSAQVFGVTFPAAPNVHINLNSATPNAVQWVGRAQSVTTTGFTMTSYGPSNTFSVPWQWTAIYAP